MPEKITLDLDGKFIALITGFEINKIGKHYAVTIQTAVHTGTEIVHCNKLYPKIFTNGRDRFQSFCTDFELQSYDTDKELDLSQILGVYCMTEFMEDEGMISITPASPEEIDESDAENLFADVEIQENNSELPKLIKHYCFFPEIDMTNARHNKLTGIITKIKIMPNRNNLCEETLCFYINVINGGRCKEYQYYINSIDTDGKHALQELCDYFDVTYNYDLDYIEDLINEICSVTLYEASSGRTYINSVEPCIFNSEPEEKQYRLFLHSYIRYLKMPDKIHDFTEL